MNQEYLEIQNLLYSAYYFPSRLKYIKINAIIQPARVGVGFIVCPRGIGAIGGQAKRRLSTLRICFKN
jgi:hypothetical protein